MKGFVKLANNLIFPAACPFCGELLEKGRFVCSDCEGIALPTISPTCLKCGCEIEDEEAELCEDCRKNPHSYISGFPALNYAGDIRDAIAAFKYHGKKNYASFFADEIIKRHGAAIMDIKPDVLVPVPIHKAKLKKRGYNQAKALSCALSKRLDVPVDDKLLIRVVNTLPQKELTATKRDLNLKKAFISTDKIVKYKCVMLVDDIYTTGATIEACTEALKTAGIRDVYYTSICIGKG